MQILSRWIFGCLLIGLTGAHGPHNFPDHFEVAKRNEAVTLTCGPKVSGDVTWKFEDDEIEESEEYKLVGPNLNVSDIDAPLLGKYSCLSGDKTLSSTHLLLEAEEDDQLDSFLKCWANSYDCTFNCSWTKSTYTTVRLGLGKDCMERKKSCQWVTSSAKIPNGGFQFVLSHSLSPYAEETTMLELTAEAISKQTFLSRTKRFYLRDIIQPDSPQTITCQEVGHGLKVTIDPPSTWSSPNSFFSLEHEIQYRLKDDGREITVKHTSPAVIEEKKISVLRARSRDPLVLSNWSQWTPWKNVIKNKKKLDLCINTTDSSCPELTSGFLECKRAKKNKKRNRKGKGGRRNRTL